ncbi:MAG: MFS transporter [Hellea sp.]
MKANITIIIAVSMVSAIGGLVFNTMPILLGTAGEAFGFNNAELGNLSLMAGVGYLAGTLTGPLWVDSFQWQKTAFFIILAVAFSFLVSMGLPRDYIYFGFLVFGFFCALAIALAMRVLADMPDPERAYGTRLSVELLSIGLFLVFLPSFFVSNAGFTGAMFGMAVFTIFLGIGVCAFPKHSTSKTVEKLKGFPSWRKSGSSWSVLLIFTIYLLANVGLFFFLYIIAQKFSPTDAQNGMMFGVLKWLGGGAGVLGAIIGAKAGLRMPHLYAFLILIVGVLGLFTAKNFTIFMISSWIWEFGFTLGCLYQTAAIVRFDVSNKLVVLVPMSFGISMIFGGKIAGRLLEGGSTSSLYMLVFICSLLPSILIFLTKPNPVDNNEFLGG